MRKYKPIELKLSPVPAEFLAETAVCPVCDQNYGVAIGRMGLRLVFQCAKCKVKFHRLARVEQFA